jgi:hypothetical protein
VNKITGHKILRCENLTFIVDTLISGLISYVSLTFFTNIMNLKHMGLQDIAIIAVLSSFIIGFGLVFIIVLPIAIIGVSCKIITNGLAISTGKKIVIYEQVGLRISKHSFFVEQVESFNFQKNFNVIQLLGGNDIYLVCNIIGLEKLLYLKQL